MYLKFHHVAVNYRAVYACRIFDGNYMSRALPAGCVLVSEATQLMSHAPIKQQQPQGVCWQPAASFKVTADLHFTHSEFTVACWITTGEVSQWCDCIKKMRSKYIQQRFDCSCTTDYWTCLSLSVSLRLCFSVLVSLSHDLRDCISNHVNIECQTVMTVFLKSNWSWHNAWAPWPHCSHLYIQIALLSSHTAMWSTV